MDIAEFFKIFFPFVNLILLIRFFYTNKISKSVRFVIFLLFSYFNFSGNFQFFFREIYQIVVVSFIFYCIFNEFRNSLNFPKYTLFLFGLSILLSYFVNNGFLNNNSNEALLNYLFVCFSTYGIISISIKDETTFFFISKYLKELLFFNSILVISLFLYNGLGYRVSFTYSNSNYLAYFLGFGMIYSNYLKPNTTYDHLTIFLTLFAVFCTGSRSVLLICIPFIIMLYLKRNIMVFILLGLAMIIISTYFMDALIEMARLKDIEDDVSILQRYEIRDVVLNIFEERPFLGIGYGRFIDSYKSYLNVNVDYIDSLDEIVTHNDYYRILSELGIVGFCVFLFVIFKNFLFLLKQKVDLFCFFSFFMALSYSYTHNNLNSFLFWFMIFIPYILNERKKLF